ncbi:uncharacterized protein [Lepisosteus oculatus]|uniref:uncharacterized protein n=1 Tax=Lepisosteus oculatus TaxID=7918 RepID=UPI0035F52FF2
MRRTILVYLTCMYLQVPVQGQTQDLNVATINVILLTLLAGVLLLCIAIIIGVFILLMKLKKIWKKLSEKDTIYEQVNDKALQSVAEVLSEKLREKADQATSSRAPTRQSSITLPISQAFRSSQISSGRKTKHTDSMFKHYSPPDYEDPLPQIEGQSIRPAVVSQGETDDSWTGIDLSSHDALWSPYVDMKSCRVSLEDFDQKGGLDGDGVYDAPYFFPCTCSDRSSTCECLNRSMSSSIRRAKHSRFYSDSSKYQVSKAFPEGFGINRLDDKEKEVKRSTTLPRTVSKDSGVASVIGSQSINPEESCSESFSEHANAECHSPTQSSCHQKRKRKTIQKTVKQDSIVI